MDLKAVQRYAARQFGVLTREDLEKFGITNRTAIHRLVHGGHLERLHPGVWRIRGASATDQQRWLAALRWAGDGILSHQSAARFHGLAGVEETDVHVTSDRQGVKACAGVAMHLIRRHLPRSAVTQVGPLRFTSVPRTLLDLAAVLDEERLQMAVESAWHARRIDPSALLAQLKLRRRRGSRKLRRLLRGAVRRGRAMESPLEVRVWRALRVAKLRRPQVQVELPDAWGFTNRADFVFAKERVVVEALGWEWHRDKFEEDAERTMRLVASGYAVIPVTWRMMDDKPELVLAWIGTALTNGRLRRAPPRAMRAAAAPGK